MESKKKVSKKQRLQQITRDSIGFTEPLPTEAKAISNLKDSQLFRSDVTGETAAAAAQQEQPVVPKKKSSKLPPSKSTLKQISKVAKHLENSAKVEQEIVKPESEVELRKHFARSEVYDFWSTGEAGLPPLSERSKREMAGRDPNQVVNEWNIGSMERVSVKRAQRVHYFNDKLKAERTKAASGLLADLTGKSYNPDAVEHAEMLTRLSRLQDVKERPALQRKMENDRVEQLRTKMILDAESKQDVDSNDEEEEDRDEEDRDRPLLVRKTKQQRRSESRVRNHEAKKEALKQQKMLDHLLHTTAKIKKDLDKQDEEAKKLEESAVPRKPKETVSLNGKRVKYDNLLLGTRMANQVILPQILPPSQLPDKMRVIPGVGGALEEQFLKLRATNVVEVNEGRKKKSRAALKPKVRKTDKFDLDKRKVAEPRFTLPEKLRPKPKI